MTLTLIRVGIVEDQPLLRKDIEILVERQQGFVVTGSCGTVEEANQMIRQNNLDILLLDIQLPDGTGFDILSGSHREYKVIFLTAFEKHAIQAIKYGALDYLLKPINEEEFIEALNKTVHYSPARNEQVIVAQEYHNTRIRQRIVLRAQQYLQIVEISEIIYCHSENGYTTFFFHDGRKIVVSQILKDYEDILSEPAFIRPHQSYLVNAGHVDKYLKDGLLILKNGVEIPVAARKKDAVLEFFNRY